VKGGEACLIGLALGLSMHGEPSAPVVLFAERFGPGWEERWIEESLDERSTEYEVVDEGGNPVLRGSSRRSASALSRPVASGTRADLRVSWRWKVAGSLVGNDRERARAGDDYAARVFVVFGPGGLASAQAALTYVWAATEPVGSRYRSPYVDEVATVVLESGDERAGRWIREARDVHADYRTAFEEDPGPVSAVALMVDTDDTGRRATAWFDDVVLEEGDSRPALLPPPEFASYLPRPPEGAAASPRSP